MIKDEMIKAKKEQNNLGRTQKTAINVWKMMEETMINDDYT